MTFNPRPDYCNILLQYVFFEKRHSSVCISNVFVKLQFLQIFTILVTICAQDEFFYLIRKN